MNKKLLQYLAWTFTILGFGVIVYFMFQSPFNDGSSERDPQLFGVYGDFVGAYNFQ